MFQYSSCPRTAFSGTFREENRNNIRPRGSKFSFATAGLCRSCGDLRKKNHTKKRKSIIVYSKYSYVMYFHHTMCTTSLHRSTVNLIIIYSFIFSFYHRTRYIWKNIVSTFTKIVMQWSSRCISAPIDFSCSANREFEDFRQWLLLKSSIPTLKWLWTCPRILFVLVIIIIALSLYAYLQINAEGQDSLQHNGGLTSTLQILFEQMSDGSTGPADIRRFFDQCKKVCPELMREPYRQHDSQVKGKLLLKRIWNCSIWLRKFVVYDRMSWILLFSCRIA